MKGELVEGGELGEGCERGERGKVNTRLAGGEMAERGEEEIDRGKFLALHVYRESRGGAGSRAGKNRTHHGPAPSCIVCSGYVNS